MPLLLSYILMWVSPIAPQTLVNASCSEYCIRLSFRSSKRKYNNEKRLLEVLSNARQKDPTIRGNQVGQKEITLTHYADDTRVLVHDTDSVSQLLKLLNNSRNISGLEVYKHKTEGMWPGSRRNTNEKSFSFKWPNNSIYALGVHFSCPCTCY